MFSMLFLRQWCDALPRGEKVTDDVLRCLQHPLEGLAVSSMAAAVPGSNARETALYGASVKVGEDYNIIYIIILIIYNNISVRDYICVRDGSCIL